MEIGAVLFDLDDTLCDTIGCRAARLKTAIARVCRDSPELDGERLLERALEGTGEPREVRGLLSVLQELGLDETAAGQEALRLFATDYRPLLLFPDVRVTLAMLSQVYRLGVVTNGDERIQREKLDHLGLTPFLRSLTASSAAGCEKPDPRIFARALRELGVAADATVFVGDRVDVDIGGAQAAEMRAVWFNHWDGRLTPDSPQPEAVIARFADLPAALLRLSSA